MVCMVPESLRLAGSNTVHQADISSPDPQGNMFLSNPMEIAAGPEKALHVRGGSSCDLTRSRRALSMRAQLVGFTSTTHTCPFCNKRETLIRSNLQPSTLQPYFSSFFWKVLYLSLLPC